MKLFTAELIRSIEANTILHDGISQLDLINRAAETFVKWYLKKYPKRTKICIFCGMGNNGADGIAIGKLLIEKKYQVKLFILRKNNKPSDEFNYQFQTLIQSRPELDIISYADLESRITSIPKDAIILDAIFGIGINRQISEPYLQLFSAINKLPNKIISIDIPSGMSSDLIINNATIRADDCLSFEFPKLSFLFKETATNLKQWNIKSIGLNKQCIKDTPTDYFFITKKIIQKTLKKRTEFSHKYHYGHTWIIAGSQNMTGAAILCGKTALKSGCGLVTISSEENCLPTIQASLPEAITSNASSIQNQLTDLTKIKSIAIGPGNVTEEILEKFFAHFQFQLPLVIDAAAIHYIANHKSILNKANGKIILTPHEGEMDVLIGKQNNSIERLKNATTFAVEKNIYILLKCNYSQLICPNGDIYFNSTGNAALAKAGSGDVLTGMIAAILAQGYSCKQSAMAATFIHGKCGDIASNQLHQYAVLATELIDQIPVVLKKLV